MNKTLGPGTIPTRTYNGTLILTGGDAFTSDFLVLNKINFPGVTFTAILDGFLIFEENTGEIEFLRTGLLQILATSNYSIGTGSSRLELSPELWNGTEWVTLNARSAAFPSTGIEQNMFMGQLIAERGHKIRFYIKAAVGSIASITTVLSNGAVIPASIIHLAMWS